MAVAFAYYDSGITVRAVIRSEDNEYADIVNEALEAYDSANIDNYDIAATETGATGEYRVSWPDWLAAGIYTIQWMPLAGASIAESDFTNRFAVASYYWDGEVLRLALHKAAIEFTQRKVEFS